MYQFNIVFGIFVAYFSNYLLKGVGGTNDWRWMLGRGPFIGMGWKPESGFISSQWDRYNEATLLYLLALGSPTFPVHPKIWGRYSRNFDLSWRDVWAGGAVTSILFTVGKTALGIYLGKAAPGSTYGAAGSLVAIVLWLYYASLILLFGAEFTKIWAAAHFRAIQPEPGALRVVTETRREPQDGFDRVFLTKLLRKQESIRNAIPVARRVATQAAVRRAARPRRAD